MNSSALTPCRARAIVSLSGIEPAEVACAYFDVGEDLHEGEHQFLISWLGGLLPLTDVRRDPDVRTFIPVNSSPTSPRFRVAADSGPADPESAGAGLLISGSDAMIDDLVSAREQAEAAGLEFRPDPLVVSLEPDLSALRAEVAGYSLRSGFPIGEPVVTITCDEHGNFEISGTQPQAGVAMLLRMLARIVEDDHR